MDYDALVFFTGPLLAISPQHLDIMEGIDTCDRQISVDEAIT